MRTWPVCGCVIKGKRNLMRVIFLSCKRKETIITAENFSCCFVVQWLSHVRLFATPGTAASQASLSFTVSLSLLKLMSIELVMQSSHLILCHRVMAKFKHMVC